MKKESIIGQLIIFVAALLLIAVGGDFFDIWCYCGDVMNTQETYEVLKNAVLKDFETKDHSHNHTFGAVLGIIMALEALGQVESVGPPMEIIGQ